MNKVIQATYAIKAMESLAKMEQRSNKVPQANLQLAPMIHWFGNFFAFYGCLVVALILAVITPVDSVQFGMVISFSIFSCFSMYWWYEMWEDRAEEIRQLHIHEVYNMKNISKADMHKLAFSIKHRPSHVFKSYLLYFVPHIIFISLWYFMFGTFTSHT